MRAKGKDSRLEPIRNMTRPTETGFVGPQGAGTFTPNAVSWGGRTWDKLSRLTTNQCIARYKVALAQLKTAPNYRVAVLVGNPGASPIDISLDFCDHLPTTISTTLAAGEQRWLTNLSKRPSGYDATYRFADVQLNTTGADLYITEMMITEGDAAYEFANGDSPGWKWEGVNSSSVGTPVPRPFWPNLLTRQRSSFEGGIAGIFGLNATLAADSVWADSGATSIRVTPNGADNNSAAHLVANEIDFVKPNATYTVCGTLRLTQTQTVNIHPTRARRITCFTKPTGGNYTELFSAAAPNVVGIHRIQSTFTVPADAQEFILRAMNGESVGGTPVWWDRLGLFEHNIFGAPPADYWVPGTT